MANKIEIDVPVLVDVEEFAIQLASAGMRDQGAFLEEFFVTLDVMCAGKPNGTNMQLQSIVNEMGYQARSLLEEMAEISKEIK